jgi:hypothetical protein
LAEFTGERVIPGEVDVDMLNEHMAGHPFAARLAPVQMSRTESEIYGYIHMPCRMEVNARLREDGPAPLLEKRIG